MLLLFIIFIIIQQQLYKKKKTRKKKKPWLMSFFYLKSRTNVLIERETAALPTFPPKVHVCIEKRRTKSILDGCTLDPLYKVTL